MSARALSVAQAVAAAHELRRARRNVTTARRIALKRRVLQSRAHLWIEIPRAAYDALERAAEGRGMSVEELAALMLDVISLEGLEVAVLDDARAA